MVIIPQIIAICMCYSGTCSVYWKVRKFSTGYTIACVVRCGKKRGVSVVSSQVHFWNLMTIATIWCGPLFHSLCTPFLARTLSFPPFHSLSPLYFSFSRFLSTSLSLSRTHVFTIHACTPPHPRYSLCSIRCDASIQSLAIAIIGGAPLAHVDWEHFGHPPLSACPGQKQGLPAAKSDQHNEALTSALWLPICVRDWGNQSKHRARHAY